MANESDLNPASEKSRLSYREAPVRRSEHVENGLTRAIEQQAAKVPSDWFLVAALAAMSVSLIFEFTHKYRASRFVSMWPEPLLIMGVYNKLVKVLGPR